MIWHIPLFKPEFGPDELEAVQRPLRDQWLTLGPITAELEAEFRRRTGAGAAIAMTNCTAALHLALLAVGVGPGDEVIVPSLTFVASANAARYCGAKVVFCDIQGENDLTLDVADVERKMTCRTKAIVVVHYAGFPADMRALVALAAANKAVVVEDCAHALISHLEGKALGTFGACGCFSFFSNKNMTCGEGGMVTTDREDIARKLRLLRSHGMSTLTLDRHNGHAWSYDCVETGWNFRIDEIRASLALAQLGKLDDFMSRRREVRRQYLEGLQGLNLQVPFTGAFARGGDGIGCHIMPVLLPRGASRLAVMEALKAEGIQSSIHYPPAHRFSAVPADERTTLERTDDVAAREITLPLFPSMAATEVQQVCRVLGQTIG
jgi:dTDP-4-amino-4,6-dideoxygalactose transaminase